MTQAKTITLFPPGDHREISVERAHKNWGEEKKARGGRGGEKEKEKRRLQTTHCAKICTAFGGLSILIGEVWLFHQQFSQVMLVS